MADSPPFFMDLTVLPHIGLIDKARWYAGKEPLILKVSDGKNADIMRNEQLLI